MSALGQKRTSRTTSNYDGFRTETSHRKLISEGLW